MPVSTFNFQFLISQWSIRGAVLLFFSPFFFKFFSLFENLASSDGWAGLTHLLFLFSVYAQWKRGAFTIVVLFSPSLGYSRFVYKQCLNNEFAYPGFFFVLFIPSSAGGTG
jgi:hypothetical protein